MSDYVLLTDSSADLTAELVAELGVEVLPLSFHMGDKTYRNWPDNREIDPKDFYRRLRGRRPPPPPSTSPTTPRRWSPWCRRGGMC